MTEIEVQRFCALFAGLDRAYGTYNDIDYEQKRQDGKCKGKAVTVQAAVTEKLWTLHLTGQNGLGIVPLRDDSTVVFGAIDIDMYADLDHARIAATLKKLGYPLIPCRSKSGGCHVYLFCSEPIPGDKMQKTLKHIAAQLGQGAAEIFPKQGRFTGDGCLGSWINIPYFDAANTNRYAVDAEGMALSLEQFLTLAEKSRVGPEFFSAGKVLQMPGTDLNREDPFADGPPCLQKLFKEGFPYGTWDTGMLNVGTFCRLSDPGNWEQKFVQINLLNFPDQSKYPDGSADRIIKSTKSHSYDYTCKTEPLHSRCDSTECRKRKFGIQECVRQNHGIEPGDEDDNGFTFDDTGLWYVETDKKGNTKRRFVSGPIFLKARARTTANENWTLLLSFRNHKKEEHELLIEEESLFAPGNRWAAELAYHGLNIVDEVLLKRYLKTRNVDNWVRLVDRIGWTDNFTAFMLPSGPVPQVSGEEWVYRGNDKVLFGTKGTLDEWRENVAKYCIGNSRLTFAVSSAFLAPLLPLLGAHEGRAFHYFHDSSSGKTTALQVAGSVCGGGGKLGFLQTWNSTLNAMEGIAAAHNHSVLLLDELGEMDSRKAGQLAYVIVGGQGKERMNRSAEMKKSLSWLNVVFSSGEISLERHMKADNNDARLMGGQEVRMVSIPADTDSGHGVFETLYGLNAAAFANMLKRASGEYYGTALPPWLEMLATRRDELVDRAQKLVTEFKAKYAHGAGPQVGRVAESFALVAAAGSLATQEGITGWLEGAAVESAARCFAAWRNARGTDGSSDEANILKRVRRFYQLHGDSRFKKSDEEKERVVFNHAGYSTSEEFWTFTQVFESEVCKGFEVSQVTRVLRKNECLIVDKGRNKTRRPKVGKKRTWYYVIQRDAIFAEEHEQQEPLPLAA